MLPLLSLLLAAMATFVSSQQIFINKVPAYSSLPHCAELPLSFIVRDMASGCGDGSKTTSYSCFCTASSSKMSGIISTAVASRCSTGPTNAATRALDVFSSYCNPEGSNRTITGNITSPAVANATITQTVTSTPTTSMPIETALSPIPSSNLAGKYSADIRVPIYAVAAILAGFVAS
ncbi:uncharacterized protein GGS22DRAFT_162807 [Annulohypoxylon maeteangense]|uniref:uncharacterized protein n=1 Tax=Annulohypoxylon maeteangense TaxID=1927788 RepID=UPI0020084C05|nr:uncharacterized protein GGS22DRAFT_162807 [Annulohypoxylon maeteangense]KAI0885117.1 hypothetical protein GGS22DRAFT_162807 [Annulohypoxylon maeteangense]